MSLFLMNFSKVIALSICIIKSFLSLTICSSIKGCFAFNFHVSFILFTCRRQLIMYMLYFSPLLALTLTSPITFCILEDQTTHWLYVTVFHVFFYSVHDAMLYIQCCHFLFSPNLFLLSSGSCFIVEAFFLPTHLDVPYNSLLFCMEAICPYCESKTSVHNSFLVTIINLFHKTCSFLLRSQDKIPLPCADDSCIISQTHVCLILTIYYA